MSSALEQVKGIVDAMDVRERLALLQYLAPRLHVPTENTSAALADSVAVWERMKEIGREMAGEPANGKSASQLLTEMRR